MPETNKKKLLLISSFSPPITGQSIASDAIYECIREKAHVTKINFSKPTFEAGLDSLSRLKNVLIIIWKIVIKARAADVVYFTISQSVLGAAKDIVIFLLCFDQLHKFILHSHGFGIKTHVLDRSRFIKCLFKICTRKIKSFIVLGPSHKDIMLDLISKDKIQIVYNFADTELFSTPECILEKYLDIGGKKINFLFLSNLLPGKGYLEVIQAYGAALNEFPNTATLTFAGGFQSDIDKIKFLSLIEDDPSIQYFGVANFNDKLQLFQKAHIFCLPTYYNFEGQPISILEAYASGCVVISTQHAGIPDIFSSDNGHIVDKKSVSSLTLAFKKSLEDRNNLLDFGRRNNEMCRQKFSKDAFEKRIVEILLG